MLCALDTPDDVEGEVVEVDSFGVCTPKLRPAARSLEHGRGRGPLALHATERDAHDVAAKVTSEPDRRAPHAAADVEYPLAAIDLRQFGERVGKLLLRGPRRYLRHPSRSILIRPQSMVDVRPPEQPIERRGDIVVAANRSLCYRVGLDHRPRPPAGGAESPPPGGVARTSMSPVMRSSSATPTTPPSFL